MFRKTSIFIFRLILIFIVLSNCQITTEESTGVTETLGLAETNTAGTIPNSAETVTTQSIETLEPNTETTASTTTTTTVTTTTTTKNKGSCRDGYFVDKNGECKCNNKNIALK